MLDRRRLTIAVLVLPAVLAASCGSSKTAGTQTVTTTSAPSNASTPTATQSTGAKTTSQGTQTKPATTPVSPRAAQTTPKTAAPPSHPSPKASAPTTPYINPQKAYPGHFPTLMQANFISVWLSAGGAKPSAECVIGKLEAWKVELGRSLAELVGFQLAIQSHRKLNRRDRGYARECHSAFH